MEFQLNFSYDGLLQAMKSSNIGLHTMYNEHFGISIVESMAAGLIMVAHNSGGPKMDIIKPGESGFLATTAEEYSDELLKALTLSELEQRVLRTRARREVDKFSDESFRLSLKTPMNLFFAR